MTVHAAITSAGMAYDPADIVTTAARCWRDARDQHAPVQQRLHAMLAPRAGEMLAPVFDSLLTLCESALGEPIVTGGTMLPDHEHLLLGLLDGSMPRPLCIHCAPGAARALDCAICATRVMMALSLGASGLGASNLGAAGAGREQ